MHSTARRCAIWMGPKRSAQSISTPLQIVTLISGKPVLVFSKIPQCFFLPIHSVSSGTCMHRLMSASRGHACAGLCWI